MANNKLGEEVINEFLREKFNELEINSKKNFPLLKFSYERDITWGFRKEGGKFQLEWHLETENLPTFLLNQIELIFVEASHLE